MQDVYYHIHTLGAGFYLETVLNAIRLVLSDTSFVWILKTAALLSILVLCIRAGLNNDFKSAIKWFLGVSILVSLFLTSTVTVMIHDRLPNSYGGNDAVRTVDGIPFGLALLGSITSEVGEKLSQKFEEALSAVFVNPDYQKTGIVFGSKIVEDVSNLRVADTELQHFMVRFYNQCIVPDVNMGYKRKNGYTIRDLVDSEDILGFLKDHASNARMIHNYVEKSKPSDKNKSKEEITYVTCNQAAHHIADKLGAEMNNKVLSLARSFFSYFSPHDSSIDHSSAFSSVIQASYANVLKSSSNDAKNILLQNVMINSLNDSVERAYGKTATEAVTASAYYAVSQTAQKFVPILRAVLECLFYAIFPLIMILMITPIGLEVLKNYAFSFVYLQLWAPLYTILFCMAGAWGQSYSNSIGALTFATHSKIANVNNEIAAISGYMLAMIPIISLFITKGMANIGNMTSSIFYIPQTAAVNSAEQGVKGNYQIGNSSIGNHSYNNTNANKHDDNYSWMSGMKSFAMNSGGVEKHFGDGRVGMDSSQSISNLAGLARIDMNKAIGSRIDQNESAAINSINRSSSNMVESSTAGYSKILGYSEGFSKNSNDYKNWQQSTSSDMRKAVEDVDGYVTRLSENHGITKQDALKAVVAAQGGFSVGTPKVLSSIISASAGVNASTDTSKSTGFSDAFNEARESMKSSNLSQSLSKVQSASMTQSYQDQNAHTQDVMQRAQSDFANSRSASTETSQAVEKLRSIQTVKGNFASNSQSMNQDLTHTFAEQGIKKYGAAGFENIVRNDPQKTNELLQTFADQQVDKQISQSSSEDMEKYQTKPHEMNYNNQAIDKDYSNMQRNNTSQFVNAEGINDNRISSEYYGQSTSKGGQSYINQKTFGSANEQNSKDNNHSKSQATVYSNQANNSDYPKSQSYINQSIEGSNAKYNDQQSVGFNQYIAGQEKGVSIGNIKSDNQSFIGDQVSKLPNNSSTNSQDIGRDNLIHSMDKSKAYSQDMIKENQASVGQQTFGYADKQSIENTNDKSDSQSANYTNQATKHDGVNHIDETNLVYDQHASEQESMKNQFNDKGSALYTNKDTINHNTKSNDQSEVQENLSKGVAINRQTISETSARNNADVKQNMPENFKENISSGLNDAYSNKERVSDNIDQVDRKLDERSKNKESSELEKKIRKENGKSLIKKITE